MAGLVPATHVFSSRPVIRSHRHSRRARREGLVAPAWPGMTAYDVRPAYAACASLAVERETKLVA